MIRDQEEAGLDIVTDGNMWYDDYVGSIGAFCWYMYERIPGFEPAREPHPSFLNQDASFSKAMFDDWGGVINSGPVSRGPIRYADLYKIASTHAKVPVKVSVGAGPVNLAWHAYFNHYKDAKELSYALAPIFNAEMKELVAAGAKYLQIRRPRGVDATLYGRQGLLHVDQGRHRAVLRRRERQDRLALLFRQRVGQRHLISGAFPEGYQTVLPHFFDTPGIDEFVLDYANRNMAGVEFLKNLPKDKSVQVGVLDVRSNAIESPQTIAARIKKVIAAVSPDRVVLSTDCGMKPLARMVAKMKLNALAEGAKLVRSEVAGVR